MRKIRVFTIALILIVNFTTAWADSNSFYAGWADTFSLFKDPNTGLTSFPTLLIPMGGIAEGMAPLPAPSQRTPAASKRILPQALS